MPCLGVVIALVAPRFLIAVLWIFSSFFAGVFPSVLWPILGFFFLPTTLLWYAAVAQFYGGDWNGGVQVIGIIIALMINASPASGRRGKRN